MIIYFNRVGVMYTEMMTTDDAMTAFHWAVRRQRETGRDTCVVENAMDEHNVFTVSKDGDEWVAERYAQEWATENCSNCDGTGKISDGYEYFPCLHCRID